MKSPLQSRLLPPNLPEELIQRNAHQAAFRSHRAGSILIENGQDIVARVTRGAAAKPAATSLGAEMTRIPDFTERATAIAAAARDAWPGDWSVGRAPADPDTRFEDPAWTWRR